MHQRAALLTAELASLQYQRHAWYRPAPTIPEPNPSSAQSVCPLPFSDLGRLAQPQMQAGFGETGVHHSLPLQLLSDLWAKHTEDLRP